MLFGRERLVICRRIVTIWLDCGEGFSLKNLKVKMIQVKCSIHNQVGFLWMPVHIDLAPWCLESQLVHFRDNHFYPKQQVFDAAASEYSQIFQA